MAQLELDKGNSKGYKFEIICDSEVYAKKLDNGHPPGFYFLVSWKGYLEEKNTWKPATMVLHLCKIISTIHHNDLKKPIAIFLLINSIPLITKPIVKPRTKVSKQNHGRPAKTNATSKRAKKS